MFRTSLSWDLTHSQKHKQTPQTTHSTETPQSPNPFKQLNPPSPPEHPLSYAGDILQIFDTLIVFLVGWIENVDQIPFC